MLKHLSLALGAMTLLVLSSGCQSNCNTNDDCTRQKGEGYVCNLRHSCELAPRCSPECSGATPTCDAATATCRTCTAGVGCGGATPVCDTQANSGAGQCITCTANDGCGSGTSCDTSVAGGRCVQCLSSAQCAGSTPLCDAASHSCKACIAGTSGVNPGCNADHPVCDAQGASGAGACVTCTGTLGCGAGNVCDTAVAGGSCVGCRTKADCSGATAVCDASTQVCRTCTASEGCASGSICDTAAGGGAGQCVACLTNAQCGGATPVCDPAAHTCVQCVSDSSCGGATPHCSPTSKTCRTCLGDNTGCSGATPTCDTTAAGGNGACVVCTGSSGCSGATPTCDTNTPGGQCVACNSNAQCASLPQSPLCNTATHQCVQCFINGSGMQVGCSGATNVCDTSQNNGAGACVVCTASLGCSGTTSICLGGTQCVQCANNSQCPVVQDCDPTSHTCVAPAVSLTTTSQQIADARATPDGVASQDIQGAIVTYKKPLTGTDVAGFFIQAEQQGPAIFVAKDPATLTPVPNVGDRVNLTATSILTVSGLKEVNGLSGFSVVNTGHPVSGLVQNLSSASDLVTGIANYESELVKLTGVTVTAALGSSGTSHFQAPISTPGMPSGDPKLILRVSDTVQTALDLAPTCKLSLDMGPMWRFTTTTQPSSYSVADFSGITCPAPTLLSAVAISSTQVRLTFDRQISPASVLANGSQFTFASATNAVTATAASVSGKTVTVTTTAQTLRVNYTVTVASSVKDSIGGAVGTPNSASFLGFITPAAVLMINEINPNITNDLVELKVIQAGSTYNLVLQQEITSAAVPSPTVLKTFGDVNVAVGDLIIVHMKPSGGTGLATTDETMSKTENPTANFAANYDSAWDVLGNNTTPAGGITYGSRVILVKTPAGAIQDAVAFFSTTATPPGSWPEQLQTLQGAGKWIPSDCRAQPTDPALACSTTALANGVSVDWTGLPTSAAAGAISMQRNSNLDTDQRSDWVKAANTFGALNAGQ